MIPEGNKIERIGSIDDIIRRMAYQIVESNSDFDKVVIAGIASNGFAFAEKLHQVLKDISTCQFTVMEVVIDKKNPLRSIKTSVPINDIKDVPVVIVDDVLNSGSTLIHAVKYFLQIPLAQIQTAVIVNRNHKRFPIKADFKGISFSTSMKEHIQVVLEGPNQGIYLS